MRFALILASVLALAAASARPLPEATAALAAPAASAADTLRFTVTAGQTLVVPLPGPEGTAFRAVRLPALATVASRSFGWRTLPGERGREYVVVERRTPAPGGGTRTDTLVLVVDVE